MKDRDGREWWSTARAARQLGVQPGRLRDWVRRSKTDGHLAGAAPSACPACIQPARRFPHVDPPVRRGRLAAYLSEQLLAAEARTDATRRGRPRAVA